MNPMHKRRLAVAAGVIVALLTARLGVWQLDRAAQKIAMAALQQQRAHATPWTGRDWPCTLPAGEGGEGSAPVELPAQQPAHLRGHWLRGKTVFLDNRPMAGQPGFVLVTPLRLTNTACAGGVVLVQRGWWPRDAQDRQRLPDLPEWEGEVEVRGVVQSHVSRTYALGDEPPAPTDATRVLRQNVDDAFWRAWLGQSPLPGALLQGHPEALTSPHPGSVQAPDLRREWPEPDLGVDKHRGYAAQWFALSALSLGLTLWFSVIRPRRAPRAPAS